MIKFPTQLKKVLPVLVIVAVVLTFPNQALADGATYIQKLIFNIVTTLFGSLVGWGGILLDEAVSTFVIGFGKFYQTSGLGFSIDTLWTTVRDIFNLTFIFGLVFIGFKMIFDSSDSNARRMLGSLVIAALLVNFSLFITKFVVDFANIASMQLASGFSNVGGKYEISKDFIDLLGLQNVWGVGDKLDGLSANNAWGYIFGSLILYVVMAFVFLAGGILLMIRFLVLNIYMVLSPVMFLGFVFPGFMNVTKDYWKGFLSRAFFAPAYILMLYFSYQILVQLKDVQGSAGFADLLGGDPVSKKKAAASVLPYFVMTSGFLIASLIVAQKMGAQGASSALAIGKRVSDSARRLVVDKTVGIAGRAVAKGLNGSTVTRANARLNNMSGFKGFAARTAVATATLGGLSKRNRQGIIDGSKKAKFGGMYSLADNQQFSRDQGMRDSRILATARTEAAINAGTNTTNVNSLAELRARRTALAPGAVLSGDDLTKLADLERIENEMQTAVNGLTTSMMEDMSEEQIKAIQTNLSTNQVENLMKSEKLSDSSKKSIMDARQNVIHQLVGGSAGSPGALITSELTKLSADQIETMGADWIQQNSHLLSGSQMDTIKTSRKFNDSQKQGFASGRSAKQKAAVASAELGNPAALDSIFTTTDGITTKARKPKEIANLGPDALLNINAIPHLTPAVLSEIAEKGTLDLDQRKQLATIIKDSYFGLNKIALTDYLNTPHAVRYGWK